MYTCTLDYETRSEGPDVSKVGAVKYAQHPTTEILCVSYKIKDAKTKLWWPGLTPMPKALLAAFNDPDCLLEAHNALFEICITYFVLAKDYPECPKPPIERWDCTAARAAACALPRSLQGVGEALKLPIQKNMRGRKLVLKYMKPRPAWVKTSKGDKFFSVPEELEELGAYCVTDTDVERLVSETIPKLIPIERKIWLLNIEMNMRGIQIDLPTVKRILRMIDLESAELQKQVSEVTNGEVKSVAEIDRVLKWAEKNGVKLPNLQAATVEKYVQELKPGPVKKLLYIRQALSKSSTKKFKSMLVRAGEDGRVRDIALYHGASTGREAGTGIQTQNFPKGSIKNIYQAIDVVNGYDRDMIKLVYGDLFNVFSSCARGMITASPGFELFAADYNAIECRMLHWFAGHEDGLKSWREGVDQYKKMATDIYNVKLSLVDDDQRFVGKQAVLGCGYGMGDRKFLIQCAKFGRTVDPKVAKKAVVAYRETHTAVTQMWSNLERAAIKAVLTNRLIKVNRTAWWVADGFLWCELPSGRRLAFYGPTVRNELTPWKELRPKLYHWSVDSYTKKWSNSATYGGKLTENVIQAAARDITLQSALRCKKRGYLYLFQVHDELISEHQNGDVEEYEKILTKLPAWAEGLPIVAKGWRGPRYKKG